MDIIINNNQASAVFESIKPGEMFISKQTGHLYVKTEGGGRFNAVLLMVGSNQLDPRPPGTVFFLINLMEVIPVRSIEVNL